MKTLKELIKNVKILKWNVLKPEEILDKIIIKGITDNSKEVKPGYIFIARKGTKFNGEDFIEEAVKNGAVAILRETPFEESQKKSPAVQLQVKDIKEATSQLVLTFYDHPEEKLKLIGVTGTNGKTSVSFFTKSVLNLSGLKAGYIGTLFYETDRRIPASETTPSIIKIAPLLKEMVDKNLKACIMEVSSHALHQDRILGLKFNVAAFTNLSRDHLDYHKGMEEYYQAKTKLFTCYLKSSGKAVISLETEYGRRLAKELEESLKERLMVVNNGEINVEILDNKNGLALLINLFGKNYKVQTQLFGDYQARNVATLCGILLSIGYKPEDIVKYLKELKNPVGRLELVASYKGAKIFVDYAHTPSALEEVLKSLQQK